MAHREFVFYFIEADEDNAANLKAEVDAFVAARAPWPDKVTVFVVNEKFDVTANAILDQLREQKKNLAPTFAFVDPFGYSGLPMELLADFLNYPRAEVFVNFMVGYVQRFIERDGQEHAMRGLFGIDVDDVLADFDGTDRIEHLKMVYERQLTDVAGFEFVQSFAMINSTGNIGYYLFHGTRNRTGVKAMKDAMWAVDPGGGFTFSDRLDGENVLFTPEPDLRPLRRELLRAFAGQTAASPEELEWYAILQTPYKDTHVRPVLRELERDRIIAVQRPRGPRQQFAAGVTIAFP
jgi:three-Cys-motif partner protein